MSHIASEPDPATQDRKRVTFLIETQIAGYHPGVTLLREHQAQSALRECDRGRLLLWELDLQSHSPGAEIAARIYDDLTRARRGKAGGPRWDLRQPCAIRLVQRLGRPTAPLTGKQEAAQERDLGTIELPGSQDRGAVCAPLAQRIDEHWQAPPRDAYLSPTQLASPGGTALYDRVGSPFAMILRVECNYRVIEGPLVFVGAEHWGSEIDQVAILTAGYDEQGRITRYYHLFEVLDGMETKALCDGGIYPLTHALELPLWPDEEEEGPYMYWQHGEAGLAIYGGTPIARAKELRQFLDEAQQLLGAALYNRGVYCPECRRAFRPALGKPALQEAAALGYVTTLCPHTWWCAECGRWSTPDERSPLVTWSDACAHERPDGWESCLTNDGRAMEYPQVPPHLRALLAQQPPHPYYGSAAFQEAWLPGMVFPPRWALPPAALLLSGKSRAADEGRHDLGRASEEPLRSPGDDESPVLVTFLVDAIYRSGEERDFVPAGTRLIGEWAAEQPAPREQVFAVVVNGTSWKLDRSHVRVTDPLEFQTQQHIAQESLAQAQAAQGDDEAAQRLYARAIVELEASGERALEIAHARLGRANCLVMTERDDETLAELERAAQLFEAATQDKAQRMFGGYRNCAYYAADALAFLAIVAIYRTHDLDRARGALERLLTMHALLTKQYDRSVDILVQAAQVYSGLGEEQEALEVLAQAERLYQERLAPMCGLPRIAHIAEQLTKARQQLLPAV